MAEPPKPPEIARRDFEVVRRGFDQQAVRAFLHEVSALVERLQRTESELRERMTSAERRLSAVEHPDESAMLELLGEETTRVLTSARDAAADIKVKAEQAAERIIAEASAQAAQTRSGAVAEADKRLAEIRAEGEKILTTARGELERRTKEAEDAAARIRAESASEVQAQRDEAQRVLAEAKEQSLGLIEGAKAEGKQMVVDAQAVRERVLRDLSAKRKRARAQIEQLNAGRDRLLEAYDVVRSTVDQATKELGVSVTDARLAAAAAARRVASEPQPTLEQLDEELASGRVGDLPITVSGRPAPPSTVESAPEPEREVEVEAAPPPPIVRVPKGRKSRSRDAVSGALAPDPAPESEPAPAPAPVEAAEADGVPDASMADFEPVPGGDPEPERQAARAAQRVALAAEPTPPADLAPPGTVSVSEPEAASASEPEPEPESEPEPEPQPAPEPEVAAPEAPKGKAADVFARLHAEADADAELPAAAEEPTDATPSSPDAQPFEDRDRVTEPIERDLGKSLKRTLADEQNEVLDRLRTAKPTGVDDLLPAVEAHAERWAAGAEKALAEAAAAGATWAGGGSAESADLADDLARGIVLPLRERIERTFVASDGNLDDVADRVKALYREWKGQRLPEAVPHYVAAAYARGVYEAVAGPVRWVVDPAHGPCPDCDDNVLAGAIGKGEEFPTGGRCAPAHPGCRCLVLPAST